MARDMILNSQRVVPRRLLDAAQPFAAPDIRSGLRLVLTAD
jgi:NAD dependent epimerase/dehydratase family enzyme